MCRNSIAIPDNLYYIRVEDNIANLAAVAGDDDREVSDQTKAECSEKDDGHFPFTDLGSTSSV